MFTRDHMIWTVGIVASALTYIAGHFDKFPYIAADYQGTVEMLAFVLGIVSAKNSMSPLPKAGTTDKVDFSKLL